RRVEIRMTVAVHVDADLDLAYELHQVDHGLAQAVPVADRSELRRRVDALRRVDRPVAVLVEPTPAGRERHRRTVVAEHRDRPEGAAAVPDDVDRDRRDAALR